MSDLSSYKCSPRQARKFVIRCITSGLVPFIQSSPAMGKSAMVTSISQEYGLELIDCRLSSFGPEDIQGLPHFNNGKAAFMPFDVFPTEDTPLPEGKQGWLLFLDEFNSASKAVQAAAYKLVLDRMVGQKRLHPKVLIVCAGNLATDRAIVNPLSTAMQSRLVHLEMELNFQEFLEDVAYPKEWDSRIIAYLNYKPQHLHDFKPDHNEKTFCAPRTWEFMNRLIKGRQVTDEETPLYAGAITSGIAVDFVQFTKVYENLPNINEIIKHPETHYLPTDNATRFATITHLVEKAEEDTLEKVMTYVERFPAEFGVLFKRSLVIRHPGLREHPSYIKSMVALGKAAFGRQAA